MAAILNSLRDAMQTRDEVRDRQEKISYLEFTKVALRIAAVGLTVIGILTYSLINLVPVLLISYLAMEFSIVVSNYQKGIDDSFTELTLLSLSPDGRNRHLLKNAPLLQSIYKIICPLITRDANE